jgi:secreted Zn-dependent insulinase-like peptidase
MFYKSLNRFIPQILNHLKGLQEKSFNESTERLINEVEAAIKKDKLEPHLLVKYNTGHTLWFHNSHELEQFLGMNSKFTDNNNGGVFEFKGMKIYPTDMFPKEKKPS